MKLFLITCVCVIFSLGTMMIFNTSSAEILDRFLICNTKQALFKQLFYSFLGCFLAFFISKLSIQDILKLSPLFLFFTSFALVLVLIPGIGICRNGSKRWLGVGVISFQPSEVAKYLIPMTYLERFLKQDSEKLSFNFFIKNFLVLLLPIVFIFLEPDNGTVFVIIISLIMLFFVTKLKMTFWVIPLIVTLIIGGGVVSQVTYVKDRIRVYLHPEEDLKGKGHQPYQAKIASGSGRLIGKGAGASLQKLTYLPEAQNDYIAAIYGEEFGFLGILFLILLYMLFSYGGMSIALKAKAFENSCLALLVTFLICFQAFLNLGVVSGLLPSKGVNLPFFSQGGTSLIVNICGLTLLLKIYSYESKKNSFCSRRYRRTFISSSSISKKVY